jgi:hypothetical protein
MIEVAMMRVLVFASLVAACGPAKPAPVTSPASTTEHACRDRAGCAADELCVFAAGCTDLMGRCVKQQMCGVGPCCGVDPSVLVLCGCNGVTEDQGAGGCPPLTAHAPTCACEAPPTPPS